MKSWKDIEPRKIIDDMNESLGFVCFSQDETEDSEEEIAAFKSYLKERFRKL